MIANRRTLIAGGAALLLPDAARATLVTRLRVAGDRLFLPVMINGQATEALLDSAAEATVIDTAFADRLGLKGGQSVTAHGSGKATAEATLVPGVTVAAAGLTLKPEAIAVVDLSDISRRLTSKPIDVVIGRELFDAARLAIDIALGTLAVIDRRREPAGLRLPLTARRGIETIPVLIEGTPAQADFDLGNGGRTLVGKAFAKAHGLPGLRPVSKVGGGGIGGETRQTAFALRRVELGGRTFLDVPAAIDASDTAADANVGVALLRNFRIVTDFAQRGVWLLPNR